MSEYNIKLQIEPENYDYGEEEIVYRIFINGQLIIERSFPRLAQNQKLLDYFSLELDDLQSNKLLFMNTKNKIVKPSKIFINDLSFNLPKSGKNIGFKFKKLDFKIL